MYVKCIIKDFRGKVIWINISWCTADEELFACYSYLSIKRFSHRSCLFRYLKTQSNKNVCEMYNKEFSDKSYMHGHLRNGQLKNFVLVRYTENSFLIKITLLPLLKTYRWRITHFLCIHRKNFVQKLTKYTHPST